MGCQHCRQRFNWLYINIVPCDIHKPFAFAYPGEALYIFVEMRYLLQYLKFNKTVDGSWAQK